MPRPPLFVTGGIDLWGAPLTQLVRLKGATTGPQSDLIHTQRRSTYEFQSIPLWYVSVGLAGHSHYVTNFVYTFNTWFWSNRFYIYIVLLNTRYMYACNREWSMEMIISRNKIHILSILVYPNAYLSTSLETVRPCAAICVRLTFDSTFCHKKGIAWMVGRGQG